MKNYFILIFISIITTCFSQNQKEQYLISSGGIGGNYNKTGTFIAKTLDSIYSESGFTNIASSGSIENVRSLDERFSDLAISQRDVLLENIYDEVNGIKNIELILPLFKENFLLYTKEKVEKKFTGFAEFTRTISNIGVTSKDGYSYLFFKQLCKLTGVDISKINVIVGNYASLAEMLEIGEIDAITSFSLPIDSLEILNDVKKIGLNIDEATLVTNKITNVFLTEYNSDVSGVTVGSWTFLVGLDTSINSIDESGKELSKELIESLALKKDPIAIQINQSINFFKDKNHHRLLNGIPLTNSLSEALDYQTYSITFFVCFILFLTCLWVLYFFIKKNILSHSYKILWVRYKHIFIGIVCVIALYFLSVEGLLFSEKEFYNDLGIKSKVLNLTRVDLHFWIIVTNLTGNNNNIFPLSYLGQLMLSFSSYILILGAIIIAFWEYIIYKLNKKRLKGMTKFSFTNHIIIIGWKENTPQFVEELLMAQKKFKDQNKKVVFIVQNPEEISEKFSIIKDLQTTKAINFVAGDAREENVLQKANLHQADTVVILSEGISESADEKTLLRALAISRYCRKMTVQEKSSRKSNTIASDVKRLDANKYEDSIYIIAELNNDKYREDLKNSDVNEIINGSEYSKNIITQSLLNHGVSKVLDEILTYNDYNEFYVIDLKENQYKSLHNKTFDELLPILRSKGILLIAIRVVYHDIDSHEIIDEHRISQLLEEEQLYRQIIVNPTSKFEINRPVDNDDQLIVFCTNASVLEKAF